MHRAPAHPTPLTAPDRPRILFLSCHLPWPALSGGRRRELELITRLARDFDIHLIVVSKTAEHDMAHAAALRDMCRAVEIFAADPPTAAGPDERTQRARHRCDAATARVAALIGRGDVDLVHVEGYYLMQHVSPVSSLPVLLVEQNVEYELEHQRAHVAGDPGQRLALFSRCLRTRAAELRAWRLATRVAAVTVEDAAIIERELGLPVAVVPDGADHLPGRDVVLARRLPRPASPLIALVANFAYAPNVDAARHLSADILPALRALVPDVHTWLVGNAPPPAVRALAGEGVTVTGRVPEIVPFIDAADVIVCPLRIGGGIKVKTIEALRRGKAIVSTPIGAQGLGAQAAHALVIESDPARFAAATARLLTDAQRRDELQRRARQAASRLTGWEEAADALGRIYDELLSPRAALESSGAQVAAGQSR